MEFIRYYTEGDNLRVEQVDFLKATRAMNPDLINEDGTLCALIYQPAFDQSKFAIKSNGENTFKLSPADLEKTPVREGVKLLTREEYEAKVQEVIAAHQADTEEQARLRQAAFNAAKEKADAEAAREMEAMVEKAVQKALSKADA